MSTAEVLSAEDNDEGALSAPVVAMTGCDDEREAKDRRRAGTNGVVASLLDAEGVRRDVAPLRHRRLKVALSPSEP